MSFFTPTLKRVPEDPRSLQTIEGKQFGVLTCVEVQPHSRQNFMAEELSQQSTRAAPLKPASEESFKPQLGLFLRTKLLPPRPAPEILTRPRLTKRLESNLARSVTLVTANAGSGKTTLVADFLRSSGRPFVWYQLDYTDGDPFAFLGYLAHGIRQAQPDFGDATFSYLQQAAGELAQQPERAVDVLLTEVLECVEQQLIIVLDDYHHLGTDTPVHAAVDRLIAYLPDVLHVIIISRDRPPLALARLRSQASVSIIDRTDLLFTDDETQELFRRVFDLELTSEQLNEYRERTHGWITALQLVRQVAQRQVLTAQREDLAGSDKARVPDLLNVLLQSERDIFDYFAEEVFADETREMQSFLLRISLLDRVEVETCRCLYPDADAAAILPALVRRNVFLTVARDERGEEYRLHPLFRSFLRRRLRAEIGAAGVAAEHSRYADYFRQQASWEQAVRHLIDAEDFDQAAKVIADRGGDWIATGKLSSLSTLAAALPSSVLEAHPRALAHRAEAARLRGDFEAAQSLFRRAEILLKENQDAEGEAEALHSLATLARRQGDCEAAFVHLDRALALTTENSVMRTKCGNTRGLCLVALGRWTDAEKEFRAALQSAEESNDEHHIRLITHNLGLPAMVRGDFEEALHWLRRMLRDDGAQPPIPQEATAHLNMARCYLYRGDLSACEQHLDRALERCQLFNLVASRAETFETYGNLYRERGDLDRAAEFYERAARSYDEAGISLARVELIEERALLSLQAGDAVTARAQIDRLVELRPLDKDEMGFYTATLARGRIRLTQGEQQAAPADLRPALNYFHANGLYYYEAQACMALAASGLAIGADGEMIKHLRRALDLAARYDYEYWLKQEVKRNPALFVAEEATEFLPADVRDLAASPPAVEVVAARRQPVISTGPVTDLTINILGPVEIVRDPARPLAADAWTTRRARDILCFIVSRRHHRASKEIIIDTFWGETDLDAVEKNFHPTVSHIRKALNSNQPLKQNFLLYRDGDYQLNPEFSYYIDTEEFERLVGDGESARRERDFTRCINCYQQAIDLYRGEFMQGSYDPWVEEQRVYYREQYLRMMEALAAVAQKTEDWMRSLQLAQQILRDDPFREDIHCMIMRAHAGLGNRVAVKEQYENLRGLLQKELGVEPALQTQKTYQELVS